VLTGPFLAYQIFRALRRSRCARLRVTHISRRDELLQKMNCYYEFAEKRFSRRIKVKTKVNYPKLYSIPAITAVALFLAVSTPAQQKDATKPETTPPSTIEGLVRDISCPIQNKEATATKFNLECAVECAKAGSPLIILTKDGVIYTPISDTMPDKDQRQRLMPFLGKYVQVTGPVFEREGTHAIAIQNIKEMKEVHLITNAK
jgi:hypothetical protein